jgi:hypothetical protein
MRLVTLPRPVIVAASLLSVPAYSHHSYAMFDGSQHLTVQGTVAKLEWANPHVFIWLYVPQAGGRDFALYGFESDSINELRRRGWTKASLKPGEVVALEFFPLRDGRNGGHLIIIRRTDGTTLAGTPGPITRIGASQRRGPAP